MKPGIVMLLKVIVSPPAVLSHLLQEASRNGTKSSQLIYYPSMSFPSL